MIQVTKIQGESFDLNTGQELPKMLVVSNGSKEVRIAVSDQEAAGVLQLMIEAEHEAKGLHVVQETHGGNGSALPQEQFNPTFKAVELPTGASDFDLVPPPKPAEPPSMFESEEPAPPQNFEETEAEPGEEYTDSLTGVGSI